MKILLVFIDMMRVDHLALYNQNVKQTALDSLFRKIGGTVLTNCYTPAPDTPRSMACMQTGLLPYFNGCDARVKWPKYFIKSGIDTIFDFAVNKGYVVNLCADKADFDMGLFKYNKNDNIHTFINIEDFIHNSQIAENSLSLITFDDYHTAIDDYCATEYGISKGHDLVKDFIDLFLTSDFINQYDYSFFFSDHGHAIETEIRKQNTTLELLKDGRTKLLMFYHKLGDQNVVEDARFASIVDLYASLVELITGEINNGRHGYSFFQKSERKFIHIEDHSNFKVYPGQFVDHWRVKTGSFDFVTNVEESIVLTGDNMNIEKIIALLQDCSPWYNDYVRQYEALQKYDRMKRRRTHYFIGTPTVGSFKRFFFKAVNKMRRKCPVYKFNNPSR